MRLYPRFDPGRGVRIACLAVGFLGGSLLVASDSFARGDAVFDASSDRSLTVVVADISASSPSTIEDIRTGLKSAFSLGNSRAAERRRVAIEPGSVGSGAEAGSALPDIQLQSSVVVNVPAADTPKARTLPAGELSREGIVHARRLQVRDGAIYLEGDESRSNQGEASRDRVVPWPLRQ